MTSPAYSSKALPVYICLLYVILCIGCLYLIVLTKDSRLAAEFLDQTPPQTLRNTKYTFKYKRWFKNDTLPPMTLLNTGFLINPSNLCPRRKRFDYLLVVKSATDHFHKRLYTRIKTWKVNLSGQRLQRVVFLLGTTPNKTVSIKIQKEAAEYGDIIQGPFNDSYHNLTLKGVMGLRWISQYCSNVTYIIIMDDDNFVHVTLIHTHILPKFNTSSTKTRTIQCPMMGRRNAIQRNSSDTWFVSHEQFKGEKWFPFSYCRGFFVVMTSDLVKLMLEAARVVPFFWIDDVYLYGLLPLTIGNVTVKEIGAGEVNSWLNRID